MPIPFLLAGLGVAAGVIGASGHISAKETNEKAQRISEDAQDLYNRSKASLEEAQSNTESALLRLGYSKKNVLDSSIKQFLQSYDKIKHINFKESVGINEISKFAIDNQEAIQLREMSNIYQSALSSGATGAATGAVIALAASGSLPLVTGVLSTAGTALVAGEVGVAAGLAGSALSFGAAMTPLAAIAAPVILFTGISSSIKADENLEKARCMYAEAEAACEKMETAETLCRAIVRKADMFDGVLGELNVMFAECARLLDGVVKKKTGLFNNKKVSSSDFTEEELKLIAVTRALAGAVKSVIDTPILSKDGVLTNESENVYQESVNMLPEFKQQVQEVKSYNFNVKTKAAESHMLNTIPSSSACYKKNKLMALLLCFFLGTVGGHCFYARRNKKAILYISLTIFSSLTSGITSSIVAIMIIIDLIKIFMGKFKDSNGKLITKWI
ncbi:MAG: NINE protein [Lachnospiraceae bacterium]|nr:NINE protein [Lachnospiraceae bacterium]